MHKGLTPKVKLVTCCHLLHAGLYPRKGNNRLAQGGHENSKGLTEHEDQALLDKGCNSAILWSHLYITASKKLAGVEQSSADVF